MQETNKKNEVAERLLPNDFDNDFRLTAHELS